MDKIVYLSINEHQFMDSKDINPFKIKNLKDVMLVKIPENCKSIPT